MDASTPARRWIVTSVLGLATLGGCASTDPHVPQRAGPAVVVQPQVHTGAAGPPSHASTRQATGVARADTLTTDTPTRVSPASPQSVITPPSADTP